MLRPCALLFVLLPAGCLSAKIDAYCDGLGACGGLMTTGTTGTTGPDDGSSEASDTTGTTTGGTASGDATSSSEATTTTATTAEASSTGTTGEPAVCGDGVVEGDEECDDGDLVPDNGCSDTCAVDIRAFVSSVAYQGDLTGLTLADALCFNRAADAGLAEPLRFKAFLSDSTTDARDRFVKGRGRIVMVNGLVLAASWDALLMGALQGPLEVTEKSETYHGPVWTGTGPEGTAMPDSSHCTDWTTDSPVVTAYYGYSDEISEEWILADQPDNPAPCIAQLALYCFESF